MKKNLTVEGNPLHTIKKVLLIMKLTFLLVLAGMLQVSAHVNGQEKVSLKLDKAEISKVLNTIEKQGTFRFLYNSRMQGISQRVNIDVNGMDIKEVLNKVFAGTDLGYKILENNLIVVLSNSAVLQDIRITGKVTGDNGEPLTGVSISVKGTATGTSTDNNGNFTLTAPENGTLVVSYIGYDSKEVAIKSTPIVNVKLSSSKKVMDEVVVIGYGTASKRDLTGSIVKIAGKEVADKPNTNPVASLQGKVAGLSVVNNGTPGAAPDIRIRGTASLGQVHPLYVVDGIFNDNIDYINPNDIESIEILKDPSSLAIFGVKGATGVIAITTKKARAGQTIVNFNTTYGQKKLVDRIKVVDASQFNTLFAEENANNNVATPDYSYINANTDWIKAVTRTGKFTTNNISVSGSTEKNKFNLGVGYVYDEGIIRHEQLSKIILSISDEFKLSKAIKVGVNVNTSRVNHPYDVTGTGTDVLNNARKVIPQVSAKTLPFRVQDPFGTDTINANLYSSTAPAIQNSGVQNPLIQLENEWNKTINIEFRTVASAFVEINFLRNFTFRSTVYADQSTVNKRQYLPLYYDYVPSALGNVPQLVNQATSVTENDDTYRKFQQDHILNYIKAFGDHHLTATLGFTTYYFGHFNRSGTGKSANATDPQTPDDSRLWYINNGINAASQSFASSAQNEYATVSELGRVLYNYKEKYFINGSVRDDASSQIPGKNRHQKFWAVGAAWDISKEAFMANQTVFDFLKIKGSTGVLGNQTAIDNQQNALNYPYYPNLNRNISAVFGNLIYTAATPAYIPNVDLKWETIAAQEGGIELNALKNRLHVEANYFNRTTRNLLTYVTRATLGIPDELINGGSIRNWGEEFAATWNQAFSKDFSVNIGGNITFLKNKVVSLAPDIPNGVLDRTSQNNGEAISETKPGFPIGFFKGYIVTGVYQSYADILKSPAQSSLGPAPVPGDLKYKDINGDGVINSSDRTVIGNPTPKFTYGGSINLTYKGFNLGIDIGGVYGNQVYRTWGALESPFQRVNYAAFELGRWHGAGTSNWVPRLSQGDRGNYVGSTYSIENGSYFRIRNLQLGYNVPHFTTAIKALRIFVNVQNLKTWKNNSGYTPEFGGDATSFGYDNGGGAIPIVATAGLNLTF